MKCSAINLGRPFFLAVVGVAVLQVACGSGDDGDGAQSGQGLTERCSGTYRCAFPDGETTTDTMARMGADCVFGGAILSESGTVYASAAREEDGLTWSGSTKDFQICGPGGCAKCVEQSSNASPGHCMGSPDRCSSLGAGSCVSDGCSFDQSVTWDGSLEYECTGTARSCERYTTEVGCEAQQGCFWQ
jgi:hypothetical protein